MVLLAGLSAAWGCKRPDREIPVVSVISPADSLTFISGQVLPFSALFTDNQNLAQYKIDIHNNFDGHAQDKYLAKVWSEFIIRDAAGTEHTENLNIPVPDSTASGWYHLLVSAVDRSGNQAKTVSRSFFVINMADSSAPSLDVTSPAAGSTFGLGDIIDLQAQATDNERVYIIRTRITRPDLATPVFLKSDTFGTDQVNYNRLIPTTGSVWTPGSYELSVTVFDSYFNTRSRAVSFILN